MNYLFELDADPTAPDITVDNFMGLSENVINGCSLVSLKPAKLENPERTLIHETNIPEKYVETKTKTIGDETYTMIRFVNISNYLCERLKELQGSLAYLPLEKFEKLEFLYDMTRQLYGSNVTICDQDYWNTYGFEEWLRLVMRNNKNHSTSWFYIKSVFTY